MIEQAIDVAVAGIADRTAVDWDALEKEAGSAADRGWLSCLRILGSIADLHQGAGVAVDVSESETEATTKRVVEDTTAATSQYWGRYRLVQKVGEGGFGSVHRAWDPELEREVAIKILHKRVADTRVRENVLGEGRALARIRHPNVVSVLGVETQDDQVALCMEFIHGETLEDALQGHGTLNAREAALVGEDVCRALAAVHLAGFVHRDIKARNVMREKAGRIVLMDFGAGRQTDDLKKSGRIDTIGTPLYMAPEVLAGAPASIASDVYGVGILLYHLVTGAYPVEGTNMDEVRAAHFQNRRRLLAERRPDLPASFIRVVEGALVADSSRRCASAAQLLEGLVSIGEEINHLPQATTWTRPVRAGLTMLGILALATLLGFINSLVFNHSLGRSDFVTETPVDWLVWGLRSCIGTAITLLLVALAVSVVIVLRRVLVTASSGIRRVEASGLAHVKDAIRWVHLDDLSMSASIALLALAATLVGAWWYFSPLLGALMSDMPTAAASDLQLLSPLERPYHELYRKVFTGIIIYAGAVWYFVWKLSLTRRDAFHRGIVAGAGAMFFLALIYLNFPYRIFYQNQFDLATWQGAECYVLGERGTDVQLFCPESRPSRTVTIAKNAVGFEALGRKENMFTRFQTNTAPAVGR